MHSAGRPNVATQEARTHMDIGSSIDESKAVETVKQLEQHYRVSEASRRTGIGRSSLHDMIKRGDLRSVKVRGMRLIPQSALTDLLAPGDAR